ncbi:CBS domain-containing protein [Geobacter sulfurreducens]|jgi:acetoin utilization protein AcuB|uniref:CBS domain pair-containing protein n=1 Tax=Geobacter sulfurreducens (strain ATCC 51573 / DSM 12127 / PCA) TaxID=243231 RepID=Q74BN1_GEOSL|nr:CBS domain-containing protein [Geobacter sulfurreducens]AAR35386.1 CBS domain pair-containing protein [Geobacter sulfurreducens PCA]ADI84844.1 CBS domain pair-containing protein [Geobacter sulfurreducens KN400]AJY68241.1 histidine kinase [Geobacter sulfurreducens]UAC02742.1 CBS domain-containing protein [Geobacter sulfurreducens]UTG91466.1 CBS domain-containing protein [Geobacter sulfurreducens]
MTKVGTWMTKNPVTIEKDATVIEAVHLMKEKSIRRLPVMDKETIVGILTEKMVADFRPSKATSLDTWEVHYILSKTSVTEAMNPKPYKVKPDTDLTEAAQLLHDRKLNGVLVVDDNDRLVGILTVTNALEALIEICKDPDACKK